MRLLLRSLILLASIAAAAPAARAEARATDDCRQLLDELHIDYRPVRRKGIEIGVEVRGSIGGVDYRGYRDQPLVLDCSLVVSLAVAGPYLLAHGIERVTYSSAYQIRNIAGTKRPSRHSFGLAIDLHTFHRADGELIRVKDDYEQGLGYDADCVGRPLTPAGEILRTIDCQLTRSGMFRIILSPDYDAAHYNHFHIEALPWSEREDVADLRARLARHSS